MNTKKYIDILDNTTFNIDYNKDFSTLYSLRTTSIPIIRTILDKMKISDVEHFTIKHTNIDNITLYVLKHSIKKSRNSEISHFIDRLKRGDIDSNQINEFINFNNDLLEGFIQSLVNRTQIEEIKYLIDVYSDLVVSKFIPIDIQTYIIKYLKNYITFSVILDTNTIHFTLFYRDRLDNKKLSILILKAFYTIQLYNKKNQTIHILLFLTPHKKHFPTYTFLGPNEINSGLTSFSVENSICIYREEEIDKLIIHEMIHALDIDSMIYRHSRVDKIEKDIKSHFNISNTNKINIHESFTETSAFIINSLINSILLDIKIDNILDYEIKFGIVQCSNIVAFYKQDPQCFFNDIECPYRPSNDNWIEKTSVLSYYFLKLANVQDIEFFIDRFMFNRNIDLEEYYANIKRNYKRIVFLKDPPDMDNSLRMTLHHLIYI